MICTHELHSALGPECRNEPVVQKSKHARETYCFKCSAPGFTSRNCPNCNVVQAESFPATENQSGQVSNESRNTNEDMEAATYMDRGEKEQSSVRQKVNFKGEGCFTEAILPPEDKCCLNHVLCPHLSRLCLVMWRTVLLLHFGIHHLSLKSTSVTKRWDAALDTGASLGCSYKHDF